MKKRHIFFYRLLRPLVAVFLKVKFGYRFQKARNLPKQYIVLSNHTTDWDPLFVAVAFSRQMYFVGSEHIARWKHAYKLLKFAFAPIMRAKGASAMAAVMSILRHIKKGANVCFFPEGVRSWDGRPCPILPSTAKLVKKAGVALVTYRLSGGYFVSPMWSGALRKGKISGAVQGVYTAEQLQNMSEEEIYDIIVSDLGEDAYARQAREKNTYQSKASAEHIEHFLFVCPHCKEKSTLVSKGNALSCSSCGRVWEFDTYGYLSDEKESLSVTECADIQRDQVAKDVENGVVYHALSATMYTVADHAEQVVDRGELVIDAEVIRCGATEIKLSDISDFAMHGKYALVFSAGKSYYEIVPDTKENMLRFWWYFIEFSKVKVG